LFIILNGQQKGALQKIKGLFRQPGAGERFEACRQELGRMAELFKVYQINWMSMYNQSWALVAGSSYRLNLVSNGTNAKGCKGTA
jgi:hypothetical protein